jgi:hypothetical protein
LWHQKKNPILFKRKTKKEALFLFVTVLLSFLTTCVLLSSVGHCAGRGDSLLDLNRPLDAEGNPVYVSSGSEGSQPGVTPTRGVETPGTSEAGPSASIPGPEGRYAARSRYAAVAV